MIYHLAEQAHWQQALRDGSYVRSTRGRSLAEEGFIHASRADQWEDVRARYYSDIEGPLVLLEVDTDLLDVRWVEEPPAPGVAETYPHVYGPIPTAAVVGVRGLSWLPPEVRRG